jgi:hypothetical protein
MPAKIVLFALLAAMVRAHAAAAAAAGDDCKESSEDCAAVGRWNFSVALGAGVRTNPLVNGENIPLAVIPHVSYYGKRFFLDDLDLGFSLAETNTNALNLAASPSYDRVYFYRGDLQNLFVTNGADGAVAVTGAGTPRCRAVSASLPACHLLGRSRMDVQISWRFRSIRLTARNHRPEPWQRSARGAWHTRVGVEGVIEREPRHDLEERRHRQLLLWGARHLCRATSWDSTC